MKHPLPTILSTLLLALLIGCALCSCTRKAADPRLSGIAELIDKEPRTALDSLHRLDRAVLSESDRHYYDFLSIKASDKAYITHRSDTLVLDLLEYTERHGPDSLYTESLYYAGRVYSDMGDYPTALRYFQQSLERIPDDEEGLRLKYRVLSQAGRLLDKMRLFSEAAKYVKESIEVCRTLGDTIAEMYDRELLAGVYIRAQKYKMAENILKESIERTKKWEDKEHVLTNTMYLANVKHKTNHNEIAIDLIRSIPKQMDSLISPVAWTIAANIYHTQGINDTAIKYACKLIDRDRKNASRQIYNSLIGYRVMLSPAIRKTLDPDTVDAYFNRYIEISNNNFSENDSRQIINQQSLYNYDNHLRKREEAERSKEILLYVVFCLCLLSLMLSVVVLWLKNRNNKQIINLQNAIARVEFLETLLDNKDSFSYYNKAHENKTDGLLYKYTKSELKETVLKRLSDLYEKNGAGAHMDTAIATTQGYCELHKRIEAGTSIKNDDPIWSLLEEAVHTVSPNFKEHLKLLVGGKFSSYDLPTALLIKCGTTATQMSHLLNLSKGAIGSRRKSMGQRIFGTPQSIEYVDAMIRLL